MYIVEKIFWIATLLVVFGMASCKKSCYHCYDFAGGFIATKNGDTVGVGVVISRTWLQDSINLYTRLGYTIGNVQSGYHADPYSGAVVCDLNTVNRGQPVPDSCSIIM